ncbi:Hypothetical protein A7982_04198 [Minicystis rosea]|nr:Hypothetical protein A7982_04198 [Minicystis rosea]
MKQEYPITLACGMHGAVGDVSRMRIEPPLDNGLVLAVRSAPQHKP